MSEVLKKLAGIRHLPIFPLPLVMLPHELLPLHIFEDRYKQMIADIDAEGRVFAIVLFEPVDPFIEKPPIGTVACIAEIKESEKLPDGRSNILAFGLVRCRIVDYIDAGEPYLVAAIEAFEDEEESSESLEHLADSVFHRFERMAKAAFKLSGSRGQFPEIQRTDPESLSFLVTAAFNFENEKKYQFLYTTSTLKRLSDLSEIVDRVVDQMEESAEIHSISRSNGHSKKKIDI